MQKDVREARHVLEPLHRHGVARDDGPDDVAPGLGGIKVAHNAVRVVLEQVAPVDHEALVDLRVERVALLDLPLQEREGVVLEAVEGAVGVLLGPLLEPPRVDGFVKVHLSFCPLCAIYTSFAWRSPYIDCKLAAKRACKAI